MDTPESLRKRAAKYQADADEHYEEARSLERTVCRLEDEAERIEARHQKDLEGRAMDIQSVCRRLLTGYLSGAAQDLVLKVLDEGEELPGFREVCATYGGVLP